LQLGHQCLEIPVYENAKPELDRIMALVQDIPEKFQSTAFEILLTAYASSQGHPPVTPAAAPHKQAAPPHAALTGDPLEPVPAELRTRFKALAAQAKIAGPDMLKLFDFSVDPFTLGSFVLDDAKTFQKARKVALLVGARSYVASGKWSADWNEVKAACVDHGCYDTNFSQIMKKAKGSLFAGVNVGQSMEISAAGQAEAKTLIATLIADAPK
jgi:hypothetical protein